MNENNVPASAALSRACVDPMCACRGGPCAECPEGQAIAAAPVAQPPATAEAVAIQCHRCEGAGVLETGLYLPTCPVCKGRGSLAADALATQPPAPVQQTEAVTRERLTDADLSDLFEIANELHGEFDKQTYDEKRRADWDLPDDHEFSVTITAAQERALSQAIIGIEASTGEQSHG